MLNGDFADLIPLMFGDSGFDPATFDGRDKSRRGLHAPCLRLAETPVLPPRRSSPFLQLRLSMRAPLPTAATHFIFGVVARNQLVQEHSR